MVIIQVIVGIVGYIMISTIMTMLFVYADRKAGETAQEVYNEDNFEEYCVAGFLFPLSIPVVIIAWVCKFIKIICIAIVELKIATDKKEK